MTLATDAAGARDDHENPYLQGPYAAIRDELIVEGLPVQGALPT